jgi:hypothetical protein
MMNIKDKLWIWGHPVNSLKGSFGITKDSAVSPMEGAKYLGANNIFYVPMGRKIDRIACNQDMRDVARVGWSIESEQQLLDLIDQKKEYPNLSIAIFDDFFNPENTGWNYTNYTIEKMLEMREKLHTVGIEMWVVLYTRLLDMDIKDYLEVFDGVSFWYWHETSEEDFEEKNNWLFENTKGQKRLIGCYLYDFGNQRELPAETVRYQLDKNLTYIKEGKIDGVILHTNAVGGMGFEAYEEAKRWVDAHCNLLGTMI